VRVYDNRFLDLAQVFYLDWVRLILV